jgi:hypothetical protein
MVDAVRIAAALGTMTFLMSAADGPVALVGLLPDALMAEVALAAAGLGTSAA